MAHVEKRGPRKYRARYRGPDGREKSQTFPTRKAADGFLDNVGHSKNIGAYVDPVLGRQKFGDYAEGWLDNQVFRASTRERVESNLRTHMLPAFESSRLASIRPSDVQGWVSALNKTHKPNTVKVAYRQLASLFRAAVNDGIIAQTPCRGIKLPSVTRVEVVPLTTEQVQKIIAQAPEHLHALLHVIAGTGLRGAEAVGLTVDRIDFLRRTIRVDRQLVTLKGQSPVFGPPKTPASARTIPVPQSVIDAIAEHLACFPSDDLVFKNSHGARWARRSFLLAFARVVKNAKLPKSVTCHDLRHFYASLLIHAGESVKTVQARLGHSSAVETLNTYGHLWHDADDATRDAVEAALGNNSRPARGLKAV